MEKDIALGKIGSLDLSFAGGVGSVSVTFQIAGGLSGSLVLKEDVAGALIPLLGQLLVKAIPSSAAIEAPIEAIVESAIKSV